MKIIFIRHSKTNPNDEIPIEQWGLTEQGIELAKSLSEHPIIRDIEVMYSSLQTKALETAVLLAKSHGIPIKTDHRFTEISSFTKRFFGHEDHERLIEDFYSGKIDRIENGETKEEGVDRFEKALHDTIALEMSFGRKTVGVVSHGNILSFFTSEYSDRNPLGVVRAMKMPDVAVFDWEQKKFITFWGESL